MWKWILAGALIGFFIFHPLVMILHHIMIEPVSTHSHSVLDIIYTEMLLSFSTTMRVWSLSFAFLGAISGYFCGKARQSVNALQFSEKKYRDIFYNIPGMFYRGNPDWSTDILHNSVSVCGYLEDEFINKRVNWSDLIHPDDKQQVFEEVAKVIKKPLSIVQEYRILVKEKKN